MLIEVQQKTLKLDFILAPIKLIHTLGAIVLNFIKLELWNDNFTGLLAFSYQCGLISCLAIIILTTSTTGNSLIALAIA